MLALPAKGVIRDDESSSCFPAEGVLASPIGDRESGESAGRAWSFRREEKVQGDTCPEQGSPRTNCRGAAHPLGEGPQGRRQVVEALLSQAPQPASFVLLPNLRMRPKLRILPRFGPFLATSSGTTAAPAQTKSHPIRPSPTGAAIDGSTTFPPECSRAMRHPARSAAEP